MRTFRTHNRRRAGFSLVELMVVITIIGLLASIVGANVYWYLQEAEQQTTKSQMIELEKAIEGYRLAKRRLPDSLEELRGADTPWGDQPIPKDAWGNDFVYEKLGRKEFTLVSYGADGIQGGMDEEADITRDDLRVSGETEE